MRYLTTVVCSDCGHKEDTTEYRKECPVCDEGELLEVMLECDCGKCYNEKDIESAQSEYNYLKEQERMSPEELWEIVWEDFVNYHKEIWYKPQPLILDNVSGFKYIGSSCRRWCYGRETYDWEDYYQCECGRTLEMDNGW